MKKLLSLILAVIFMIGCIPAIAAAEGALPFKDVKEGAWYYPSVKYVYENDLMNGTGATAFSPGEKLSRAMFITIIGRLVGAGSNDSSPFSDTKPDTWYSPYVAWASGLGIINGFPDGTFRPNDPITREQMAAATDRFLTAVGLNTIASGGIFDFADEEKISGWAQDSVGNLKKVGIFSGDTAGRFNPKSNTTRAEAATVVMRLRESINKAWQGYVPRDGDNALVFGAKYLFENGTILAGGMNHGLDVSGDVPILTAAMDTVSAVRSYNFPNTVGVSVNCAEFKLEDYPFVKICYGYDGMEETPLTSVLNVNMTYWESSGFRADIPFAAGEDEDGMKTATADLTGVLSEHTINYATQLCNLLFSPCDTDYDGDGQFLVRYIGFFKTEEDAAAFTSESDADILDYLKNYDLGSTFDYREYTDADREYYDKLLVDRIGEIKNAPSEVTPDQIKARGGTCWYVSSIHGDDKNDGKSPDKPFRTLDGLVKRKFETSEGTLYTYKTNAGDGVFFERGSVFYPEVYHNNMVSNLQGQTGVDYGAYGVGPKPLFTCALDYDKVGKWHSSGYPNVWMIDCVDDTVRLDDEGDPIPGYWWGSRSEISNIYFNGGEGVGLRIVAKGEEQTLGAGLKSTYRGLFFNGYEYYESETRALDDPGTALLHNLEYFHDYGTGSLYLYWDKGDPNEYFDDIKASRNGTCAWIGNDSHVDNLAFLYSGTYCVEAGESNLTFTNCEIGFVHGALSSVESGIESFGKSDGIYMINNYIHDVGDGGLTSQCTGSDPVNPNQIKNVNYIGNVFVAVGVGAEIWNHLTVVDESGVSLSKITNCTLKDNLFAYGGWGMSQKQSRESFITGSCVNGSMYGEFVNSRIENNVFLYPLGCVYYAYMATYRQPRGWESLGNVYVVDGNCADIIFSYETINYINHGMWKRARVYFPYTEEGLRWITSLGVDPKGIFYHYEDTEPTHTRDGSGFFFMTGYYAERGENPSLIHD